MHAGAGYGAGYGAGHYQGYSGSSFGSVPHGNYGNYGNLSHSQNYQSYHHPNGYGNWGHDNWNNSFRHGYWGPGWYGWGGWGFPFGFGYWGGYPYGWGGYWGDYFYPYGPVYGDAYPMSDYGYTYPDEGQYAANYPAAPSAPVVTADNLPSAAGQGDGAGNEGLQFYDEARAAFTQGDYRNALRLAEHAGVESPQNAKVHELIALALLALEDYRGAATAAHAALALAPPSDWNNLYSYYNDADKYTAQLRKLEKTVADVPSSAAGHFLLGYHYLMTGAKAEAKTHFAQAAKLTPNDKLAQHILKQLESNGEVKPPELPAPKPSTPEKGKAL
jgi:tetratricopeptide (TPR) repeat protein